MWDTVRDRVATEYRKLYLDDIFHVTREIYQSPHKNGPLVVMSLMLKEIL